MTLSPLTTDQPILEIIVGTDWELPVTISKSKLLLYIRSMTPFDVLS